MRKGIAVFGTMLGLAACGLTGPAAIQKITTESDQVIVEYDPAMKSNAEMRDFAREQCKKQGRSLRDVTVSPTPSPTTSIATIYCA